jgi:hypothetical protein
MAASTHVLARRGHDSRRRAPPAAPPPPVGVSCPPAVTTDEQRDKVRQVVVGVMGGRLYGLHTTDQRDPCKLWAASTIETGPSFVLFAGQCSVLFGCSVLQRLITKAEPEHRCSQNQKPKPKTEKTDILVRFGVFSVSI